MTKKQLAIAITLSLSLGLNLGLADRAFAATDPFKNFANAEQLKQKAEEYKLQDENGKSTEYGRSSGLKTLNAANAYALGYSGAGITLGMVDTAVNASHIDLKDKVEKLGDSIADEHGTHVAGIMCASKNDTSSQGIAYDANLIAIGANSGNNNKMYEEYYNDLKNAKIINNSWGRKEVEQEKSENVTLSDFKSYPEFSKLVTSEIEKNDKIFVVAAGNNGFRRSDQTIAALGLIEENSNNYVNVVAANSYTGTFAAYSNLAGNLNKYTVMAPGSRVFSTSYSGNSGGTSLFGTSQAAPYVSGSLALIQEAMPYMNGKQLLDSLFTTCDSSVIHPNCVVQIEHKMQKNGAVVGSAVNVTYIDTPVPNDSSVIENDIRRYYRISNGSPIDSDTAHLHIADEDALVELYKKNGSVESRTSVEVWGYGMVDAGRAVQGPAALDAARLSSTDLVSAYNENGRDYLYSVDTGKSKDNYRFRDYSIWSNDIEQWNAEGNRVGLKKDGEVNLILLGENTYQGPTVVNSGKLQIVKGVEGDVFASGLNGKAEAIINGNVAGVYALSNGNVRVEDKISVTDNFLSQALPKTTAVNITGGIFAAGDSSGDASINVKLNNSNSKISGPIYQNQYGQLNLTLNDYAKLNIKQGSGYYNHNTLVGNNAINYLCLNHHGQVSLKDNSYDALAVNYLDGYDGQFLLNSDYNNAIADKLLVNNGSLGEHKLGIYDKSGYMDSSKGDALLVAVAPEKIAFTGLAVEQGVYDYTPQFVVKNEEELKKWYFIGFSNSGEAYDGPLYTGEFNYLENEKVTNNFYSGVGENLLLNEGDGNKRVKYVQVNETSASASIKGDDDRLNGDGYDKVIINLKGLGAGIYAIDTNTEMEINLSSFDSLNSKPYVYSKNHIYAGKKLTINVDGNNAGWAYGYSAENNNFVFEEGLYINMTGSPMEKDYFHNPALYLQRDNDLYGDIYINSEIVSGSLTSGISNYKSGLFYRTDTNIHGDVNINVQGEGDGSYIAIEERLYDKKYPTTITIDGDLNINMPNKDIFINDWKTTLIEGELNVGGDINIINGDLYGHNDNTKIAADNIYVENGDISVTNLNVQNNLTCDNLWIGEEYSHDGKTEANVYGSTNVKSLCLDAEKGYYGRGKYNFNIINCEGNVEVLGNDEYYKGSSPVYATTSFTAKELNADNLLIKFSEVDIGKLKCNNIEFYSGDLIVNKDKSSTVQIDGDITHYIRKSGSTTYHYGSYASEFYLTDKASYFNGYMDLDYAVRNTTFELSNGASWNITPGTKNLGKLNMTLNNDGKIYLPYDSSLSTTNFAGHNGIFEFQLHQDVNDRSNISCGSVNLGNIDIANTSNQKILFTPDSADFLVEAGQSIKPFNIFSYYTIDSTKDLFNPLPFDAGAYTYTPVLEVSNSNCKVVGIVPLGNGDKVIRYVAEADQSYDYSKRKMVIGDLVNCENNTITVSDNTNIVNLKGGINNTLNGGLRVDVFNVRGDEQTVYGGAGNDILSIKEGNRNIINGGAGNDRYSITNLAVKGEYLIDQSSASGSDRDTLSLASFNKADFEFRRSYDGDLVIAQKGEDGAVIYVRGWDQHALNNVTFKDGRISGKEITELADAYQNEWAELVEYADKLASTDTDTSKDSSENTYIVSGGAPTLSNLTNNVHKTAINNAVNFRNEYNNLRKRLGDLHLSKEDEGIWARNFHGRQESSKYGFSGSYNAFQLGYDKSLTRSDGDKWLYGIAASSYQGKNSLTAGKVENKSVGGAVYGTYIGEKGHYLDLVARHSRQSNDMTSIATGSGQRITGEYHNWGTSVSAEYGRRIELKQGYYLQPEAELIYGHVYKASYTLSDDSRVKQAGLDSVTGRLGLSIGKNTKKGSFALSASYLRDFGDTTSSTISDKYGKSNTQKHNTKDSWLELDLGGNLKVGNNTYIYGDMEKSFGGDVKTKWRYNVGVRCNF